MYGLLNTDTNKLMYVTTSALSGDHEFSASVLYELSESSFSGSLWLVESKEEAEAAAIKKNYVWYECDSYETPRNNYINKLKVVEVDIIIK